MMYHCLAIAPVLTSDEPHRQGRIQCISCPRTRSMALRTAVMTATITSTPTVPATASLWLGHVTLRNSVRTSIRNCLDCANHTAGFHCIELVTVPISVIRHRTSDGLAGAEGLEPPTPGFG